MGSLSSFAHWRKTRFMRLPDRYRRGEGHYRITRQYVAIDHDALQKGLKPLQSPLAAGILRLFACYSGLHDMQEVRGSSPLSSITVRCPKRCIAGGCDGERRAATQPAATRKPATRQISLPIGDLGVALE